MQHLTDEAAGANLGRILNQVAEEFNHSDELNYRTRFRTLF